MEKDNKETAVIGSAFDPGCGVFHKGEHKMQFAHEAQPIQSVMNMAIYWGVLSRPEIFTTVLFLIRCMIQLRFPEIKEAVADAAYKTLWICKKIIDDERIPIMPYKRPMGGKDFFNLMNMYMMNIMIALSALITKF